MSRRRKHLTQQKLAPPTDRQQIVRAKLSRGSNIFEAETADGRQLLCFLPAKFNKKLWIKRGGYIIVEEGDLDAADKVTAVITKVLYEEDVKALKKLPGVWPAAFANDTRASKPSVDDMLPPMEDSEESNNEDELSSLHEHNTQHVKYRHEESDS